MTELIRPQRWSLWTSSEREAAREINQVMIRKIRNRYSALRNRPAVRPFFGIQTLAGGSGYTAMGPGPAYMGIPNGAQRLLCRAQVKANMTSNVQTSFIFRCTLGSHTGKLTQRTLSPNYDPDLEWSLLDGNVLDNDDTTWWDMTSIIPDPTIDGPFVEADWNSGIHLIEVELSATDANLVDLEVRTDRRQWEWISEDYLPTMPPDWQAGTEYT